MLPQVIHIELVKIATGHIPLKHHKSYTITYIKYKIYNIY